MIYFYLIVLGITETKYKIETKTLILHVAYNRYMKNFVLAYNPETNGKYGFEFPYLRSRRHWNRLYYLMYNDVVH